MRKRERDRDRDRKRTRETKKGGRRETEKQSENALRETKKAREGESQQDSETVCVWAGGGTYAGQPQTHLLGVYVYVSMPCLSVVQVPFRCALAHPCACPWTAPYIMHTPVISARLLIRAPFRLVCYSQVEDSHFSKPICSKCAEKRKMLQGCKVHCSHSFVTRARTHTHTLSLSHACTLARTLARTPTHPPTCALPIISTLAKSDRHATRNTN